MKNVRSALFEARKKLKENGVVGYNSNAEFLLAEILDTSRSEILTKNLSDEQYEQFLKLVDRRCNHEPMDSLLGYTDFLGLKIPFSKDTLTPRQETEILADRLVSDLKKVLKENSNIRVLDLCSGSGCIGLALKYHLPLNVTLADISVKALEMSRVTAEKYNLKVNFIQSDLFSNIYGVYDIIICNPPYVKTGDISTLEKEVLFYDPITALDGGEDGLDFYRRLSTEVLSHLSADGTLYLEVGMGESKAVSKMFAKDFDIEIIKDYSGIERFLKARRKYA